MKKATKTAKAKKSPKATKTTKQAIKPIEPEISQDAPQPVQIVDEVLVIRLANNPRYVYASKDGERISVEVPMWMSPRLPGKTIKVVKNPDSEHYSLAPADGN